MDSAQPQSWKNLLQEHFQKQGLDLPKYSTSVTNANLFVATVLVPGNKWYSSEALSTKKAAEQRAAQIAYEDLLSKPTSLAYNGPSPVSKLATHANTQPTSSPHISPTKPLSTPTTDVVDLNSFSRRLFDVCRDVLRKPQVALSELKAVVKTLGQMVWQGPDSIVPRAQLELLNIMMDASVITEVRTKATELVVNWALRDPSQTDATLACLPVLVKSPDWLTAATVTALSRLGQRLPQTASSAITAAKNALASPAPDVRRAGIVAIGRLSQYDGCVWELVGLSLANYPEPLDRIAVLHGLAKACASPLMERGWLSQANSVAVSELSSLILRGFSHESEFLRIRSMQVITAAALRDPERHFLTTWGLLGQAVKKDEESPAKSAALKCIAKLVSQFGTTQLINDTQSSLVRQIVSSHPTTVASVLSAIRFLCTGSNNLAQSLQAIIPNVTDALQDKATLPKLAELQLSLSSIAAIMFGAPTPTVQRPLSKPPSIIPPMQYAFPRNSTTQFSFPDAETSIMPLDSMITDDTEIRRLCRRFGSVVIGHVIAIFNNDLDAQHEEFDPFFVERAYNDIVSVQQVTSASDTSTRIGLATVIRGYQSLSNLPYERNAVRVLIMPECLRNPLWVKVCPQALRASIHTPLSPVVTASVAPVTPETLPLSTSVAPQAATSQQQLPPFNRMEDNTENTVPHIKLLGSQVLVPFVEIEDANGLREGENATDTAMWGRPFTWTEDHIHQIVPPEMVHDALSSLQRERERPRHPPAVSAAASGRPVSGVTTAVLIAGAPGVGDATSMDVDSIIINSSVGTQAVLTEPHNAHHITATSAESIEIVRGSEVNAIVSDNDIESSDGGDSESFGEESGESRSKRKTSTQSQLVDIPVITEEGEIADDVVETFATQPPASKRPKITEITHPGDPASSVSPAVLDDATIIKNLERLAQLERERAMLLRELGFNPAAENSAEISQAIQLGPAYAGTAKENIRKLLARSAQLSVSVSKPLVAPSQKPDAAPQPQRPFLSYADTIQYETRLQRRLNATLLSPSISQQANQPQIEHPQNSSKTKSQKQQDKLLLRYQAKKLLRQQKQQAIKKKQQQLESNNAKLEELAGRLVGSDNAPALLAATHSHGPTQPHNQPHKSSNGNPLLTSPSPFGPAGSKPGSKHKGNEAKKSTKQKEQKAPREPCVFHSRGFCHTGAACPFSHSGPVQIQKVCKYYRSGACRNTECRFSHDLSHIPCEKIMKCGTCDWNEKCGYSHDPSLIAHEKQARDARKRELEDKIAQNRKESGVPIFEPQPASLPTASVPQGSLPSSTNATTHSAGLPPKASHASAFIPPSRLDAAKELFGLGPSIPSISWEAVRAKSTSTPTSGPGPVLPPPYRPPPLSSAMLKQPVPFFNVPNGPQYANQPPNQR